MTTSNYNEIFAEIRSLLRQQIEDDVKAGIYTIEYFKIVADRLTAFNELLPLNCFVHLSYFCNA